MAVWVKLNTLAFADQLQPVAALVGDVAAGLETVDGTLNTAIDGLSAFTETYTDPAASVTQAIITEIENLIADLAQIGAAGLTLYPKSPDKPIGWTRWKQTVIDSFFDTGDLNRPTYSDAATCGGMVIVGAAPGYREFLQELKPLATLLDWRDLLEKLTRILAEKPPAPVTPTSIKPDWQAFNARLLTPVADGEDYLLELMGSIRFTVAKGKSIYQLFAESGTRTIQRLLGISQRLQEMIALFTADLAAADIYTLTISEQVGGVNYWIREFQTAVLPPIISESAYVGGIALCGGTGTLAGLQKIL